MSENLQAIEKAISTKQPKDVVLAFLLNTSKELVANAAEKNWSQKMQFIPL